MNDIIRPGAGILFMKVGTHAQETIEDIISRKTREIENAGHALWGYGGNTCHPQTMVQPFARRYEKLGGTIYLCMEKMDSSHFAEPLRADEFSEDGISWNTIPAAIDVVGSRFALVIRALRRQQFELPLRSARVAIGNSQGRLGSDYIKGRVDKACFEIADMPARDAEDSDEKKIQIDLVAELASPYAVYVRNRT